MIYPRHICVSISTTALISLLLLFTLTFPAMAQKKVTTQKKEVKKGGKLFKIEKDSVPVLNGVDSIPALANFMKNGGISVFFDVSKPLLNYIKNNPNCATVKQDFEAMGRNGVTNLYNAILGKPFEESILYDVKVIDQSNVDEELSKL